MTNRNDITGDIMQTRACSDAYSKGWDLIFKKQKPELEEGTEVRDNTDSGVADYD